MALDYDIGMRVDVLVHPYWSDFARNPIDFPNPETHEKTRKWRKIA